ncbi:helix-turn-helix transcriptional regulator [Halobacterium noricense]|uniref:helix-turn-helix transcriptional regulator n=1 Tax=Halobacterium noricense TaxID=223182 RepID=UPI001E5CB94F|nr:MarR family transcriptional regulator [Halobacterium noricense]UHH25238.1 helix-turn-helix domain-containing protein [Halobacterium noricense]
MTAANPEPIADDSEAPMSSDAIESVAFLARSEHRLRVLDLLSDGPRSRDELSEKTGVTRVTLSRILGDLTDRGLIARHTAANDYALTGFGDLVYEDFTRLLGTVSVGQRYPDVVGRLPTEWFGFDLRHLRDSELVTGGAADPLSAARIVANTVREASSCRSLLGTFISVPMYAFEEALRAGDAPEGMVVFDAGVTETMLDDPDLRERWQEIEAAVGSTVYYSVDDRVPCSIDLVDDETVFLTVDREHDGGFDVLRCTHPEVVAWARETVMKYREDAVPLGQRAE